MKVGVIGYSQCGRSTLYRAAAMGKAKGDVTAVPVPDPRFDAIVEQVKPKKATPATVVLHDDFDAIHGGGKAFTQRFLDTSRNVELLLHVVRAFENPIAPYHTEIDPLRDQEAVDVELVLADLQIVENRLERLHKSMSVKHSGSPEYMEHVFLSRLKPVLEDGKPIRSMELNDEDYAFLRNYQLLTAKSMVVAFNVGETEAACPPPAVAERIAALNKVGTPAFAVCATLEEELAQLDAEDRQEFLDSMGLTESASAKVVKAVYDAMGLITFFTAGENDTHAWPLRAGSSALKAAGTIHTDIARGFIRAEVVHFEDYENHGSLHAAYAAGKMVLEGKDYPIRDGDLLHIRNKV